MSAALHDQPTSQHLHVLLHLTQVLDGLGVTVRFTEMPHDRVAEWHSNIQTAFVRRDAYRGNQAWYLGQLLMFLTAGPAGSPAVRQQRNLRLVTS
jgi:hypothetical protein